MLWEACGLERSRAGPAKAIDEVAALREAFWQDVTVPGGPGELNQELERAGRVADFLELGELMCRDALARDESCGCHFRVEHQTAGGRGATRRRRASPTWRRGIPGTDGRASASSSRSSFETLALRERSYR